MSMILLEPAFKIARLTVETKRRTILLTGFGKRTARICWNL